jgi:hypothetical protein
VPLLAGKDERGRVTTYICQGFTCREPLLGPEAVESALAEKTSAGASGPGTI